MGDREKIELVTEWEIETRQDSVYVREQFGGNLACTEWGPLASIEVARALVRERRETIAKIYASAREKIQAHVVRALEADNG